MTGIHIRRRELITLLGGAAAAWPVAARAQQAGRTRRVAVLASGFEDDLQNAARITSFRDALAKLGWADGRNVRLDVRSAGGDRNRLQTLAADVVATRPDVIFAAGVNATEVLQQTTQTVPIVFAQIAGPVELGFVTSVPHPGGNMTGFALFEPGIAGKWLELLKELAPHVARVSFLYDPVSPSGRASLSALQTAAPTLGVELSGAMLRNADEITPTIEQFAREPNGGLIVMQTALNSLHRDRIIALAAHHKLPAVYLYRYFVVDGGLASYGVDLYEDYRLAATYVDRILKGEKPGDLPVQFPTRYELVINLKTAKALGLDPPVYLLARTDEVIE
jgi:putative tryptophan/tyrosine transport system substrate-binding protein